MLAPVEGVRRAVAKAGWDLKDVELFELNEAFSVQALGVVKELGIDPEIVNVNGGAVAIGHAIGNSGGRVLTTLLYEMKRRGVKTRRRRPLSRRRKFGRDGGRAGLDFR